LKPWQYDRVQLLFLLDAAHAAAAGPGGAAWETRDGGVGIRAIVRGGGPGVDVPEPHGLCLWTDLCGRGRGLAA